MLHAFRSRGDGQDPALLHSSLDHPLLPRSLYHRVCPLHQDRAGDEGKQDGEMRLLRPGHKMSRRKVRRKKAPDRERVLIINVIFTVASIINSLRDLKKLSVAGVKNKWLNINIRNGVDMINMH